jgi:hypothetical protein
MDYSEIVYHLVMKESMCARRKTKSVATKKKTNSFENNTNGAKAPISPPKKDEGKEYFDLV